MDVTLTKIKKEINAATNKIISVAINTSTFPTISSMTYMLEEAANNVLMAYQGQISDETYARAEVIAKEDILGKIKGYDAYLKQNNILEGTNVKKEIDVDPSTNNGRAINYPKQFSAYGATNSTYSMADMVCTVDITTFDGKRTITALGSLQTLSYSIHNQKTPVRNLGNINAKDWVHGPRTIAGSLVFAVFNKHWMQDIYASIYTDFEMKNPKFIMDELPPFNITISFANEYGYDSRLAIYGVRIVNEGQVMSSNDIYIENTYQYVALDIDYMDELGVVQTGGRLASIINNTDEDKISQEEHDLITKDPEDIKKYYEVHTDFIDFDESDYKNMTVEAALAKLTKSYENYCNETIEEHSKQYEGMTEDELKISSKELNQKLTKIRRSYQNAYAKITERYAKGENK